MTTADLAKTLHEGDSLSSQQLCVITGASGGTDEFRLAVLGLRNDLMREFRSRGRPATVILSKGALAVLTHEEAVTYNRRAFDLGLRKANRAYRRLGDVDARALSADVKKQHERALLVTGKVLAVIKSTKSQLSSECRTHARATPVIPGSK